MKIDINLFLTLAIPGALIFLVLTCFNRQKKTVFAIALPLLLFIKLAVELVWGSLAPFDQAIYQLIQDFISEEMTFLMRILTLLGSWQTLMLVALLGLLIYWQNPRYSFSSKMLAADLLGVYLLNETLKMIFQRERPGILRLVEIGGFSFPSGHAMISIGFYGFIAYLLYRNMKSRKKYFVIGILTFVTFVIGVSRIYLGVHYASDVIAGFAAGLAWLAIFIVFFERFVLRRKKEPKEKT